MNYIEINGGTKREREVARATVEMMIKKLLPRFRTLEITVNLKKLDGVFGYCLAETTREFELEVAKGLSLKNLVGTICHEMVHVKQYARKELHLTSYVWKKTEIDEKTPYSKLPWEVEAFGMEDDLAREVWDADIL
jgi:hypothetical protein